MADEKKKELKTKPYKKGRFCPRDGAGTRLAEHKNRWSCGKCGYVEFKKKEAATDAKPITNEQPSKN